MPHARIHENMGLSFISLAKNPELSPRIANPPTTKGFSAEKLIYNPPIAPVIRPIHGPASMPLISMGNWVKCMLEFRGPRAIGITKGVVDRMFDRAAIAAMKVMVFVVPTWNFKMLTRHPNCFLGSTRKRNFGQTPATSPFFHSTCSC